MRRREFLPVLRRLSPHTPLRKEGSPSRTSNRPPREDRLSSTSADPVFGGGLIDGASRDSIESGAFCFAQQSDLPIISSMYGRYKLSRRKQTGCEALPGEHN